MRAVMRSPLSAHWRYLRYVLRHKAFVFRAGILIGGWSSLRWVWRLVVHDLSKFSRAEWSPYVAQFYGVNERELQCARCQRAPSSWKIVSPPLCGDCGYRVTPEEMVAHEARVHAEIDADSRAFKRAWLHHIHANNHHWQHWILHEDSGRTFVLVPPRDVLIWEMVADWLAAGPKVNRAHSMAEAVAETIVWYTRNSANMQMRQAVRTAVETMLLALAQQCGLDEATLGAMAAEQAKRATVTLGR